MSPRKNRAAGAAPSRGGDRNEVDHLDHILKLFDAAARAGMPDPDADPDGTAARLVFAAQSGRPLGVTVTLTSRGLYVQPMRDGNPAGAAVRYGALDTDTARRAALALAAAWRDDLTATRALAADGAPFGSGAPGKAAA